ncbi:lipopolysaccharide transport periplasmic protein LptA [Palleronia rufa]|uniref:lipopolysaccharide transport periplasmic protein LptA n=1 Tax=Palleronia rufa TaxID=1530186 RepID=UPI00055F7BC9|nr:lipopolysaccharide transport periplasmic protein LptA [Palleronia rufa]
MIARALTLCLLLTAAPVTAQQAAIEFGGLTQDTSLPVEVAADNLDVSQTDGTAVFTGNVLVTQGEMKLSADRIQVVYATGGQGRIRTLNANGGVTLVNGSEAAEASEAVYDIDAGNVVMTGDVLLTQGQTALSGNRLVIDLTSGTGRMEGRVRTIFETSGR